MISFEAIKDNLADVHFKIELERVIVNINYILISLTIRMESKGTPIDTLRDKWDDFSDVYCRFDPGPQTFYFSLVNLLKFRECKNILEIACGSGRLLPYIVSQKPKDTQYVATDLSPEMIKKAEKNMRDSLELFGSKHSYEDFMKENRMFLKACDG